MRSVLMAGLAFSVLVTSAQAASVKPVKGHVLIDVGAGFEPLTTELAVLPGTRVMVSQTGVAQIDYGAGCTVAVIPGSVPTVSDSSPCQAESLEMKEGRKVSQTGETAAKAATDTPPFAASSSFVPAAGALAFGAGVIGVGTGVVFALSGGRDPAPASP
ncbi:MAG: hypothetical protein AAFR75_06085 [Pseudomonadota bacterium]